MNKEEPLKIENGNLPGSTTTRLELVDAVANYGKHHDGSADRSKPGPYRKATKALRSLGMEGTEALVCIEAADALHEEHEALELRALFLLITVWRRAIIQEAKCRPHAS